MKWPGPENLFSFDEFSTSILCSIPSLLPNGFIDVFAPFANSAYWNMCSGGVPKKKKKIFRNNEMSHAHGPYLICQITDKHLISTPAQTTDLRLWYSKSTRTKFPKMRLLPREEEKLLLHQVRFS